MRYLRMRQVLINGLLKVGATEEDYAIDRRDFRFVCRKTIGDTGDTCRRISIITWGSRKLVLARPIMFNFPGDA
jgi:hypothetical protein